ncbi:hypothetical protein SRABI84_04666 [Peribacillus simplex]|nr:hypothetical protein SRABI84_04666 [Peribacillus simplex]
MKSSGVYTSPKGTKGRGRTLLIYRPHTHLLLLSSFISTIHITTYFLPSLKRMTCTVPPINVCPNSTWIFGLTHGFHVN